MAQFNFVPPPEEQAYYAALFEAADAARAGVLAGREAVAFLSQSGVPMDTLKTIWTLVDDHPKTSNLDRRKFANAVRLIQLHQNGQRPVDAALGAPVGVVLRPAMFEGVSGVSVPLPGQGGSGSGGPPPPQQQQAPPMQQQMQQAPPTPQPYADSSSGNTALTAQDPYAASPSDLSRYDALFPQYASAADNGTQYIYGPEAVALFSKSGADQAALRAIWTMVDADPVDNRLDPLEFALAMHLIVCVTKKGLPVPPGGALPPSLRAVKDRAAAARGGQSGQGGQGGGPQQQGGQPLPPVPPSPARQGGGMGQQMGGGPPPVMPGMGVAPPSPMPQQHGGGQPQMQQQMQQQQPQMGMPQHPGMGGSIGGPPPPAAAPGGVSISDAFEGMAAVPPGPSSVGGGDGGSYAAGGGGGGYGNAPPSPSPVAAEQPLPVVQAPPAVAIPDVQPQQPEPVAAPAPVPVPLEVPAPAPAAPAAPAAMGIAAAPAAPPAATTDELSKLQATLQKLQAENISLKAKLGDVSEEEADVRREIGQTVSEIGRLSQELTGLREQVAEAKSALIEATAELKAQKEKKGTITDLIDEERQTLGALNDARSSIQDLHATNERIDQQQEERNAAGNAFESDLFGGSAPVPMGDPAPAPVPVPEPEPEAPVPAPVLAEPVPAPVPVEQPAAPAPSSEYMQASAPQYGGYMGGAPPAAAPSYEPQQPEMVPMGGMSVTNAPASLNPGSFSHNSSMGLSESLSTEEIDVIKQQVTELDRKAVAAEDSQRQLISQVEYLRREAEQAEVDAAEKVSAAEGTKKKRFGKSGKKGAMKDADSARAVAFERKKAAEAAQAALSNAQAEAIKAKRQADELRLRAEEAELQAASAASMQSAPVPPAAEVPPMDMGYAGYAAAPPPMGGTAEATPMGGGEMAEMANGHGMMGGAPAPQEHQYLQQPMGVMGGGAPMGGIMTAPDEMNGMNGSGGMGIPTPRDDSQNDDYTNPFAGW